MNICNHIKNLEQRLLTDEGRRDVEFINKVLADNFTELGSSGQLTLKDDVIEWLLHHEDQVEWSMFDFSLRELTEDTVIAVYRARKTDLAKNKISESMRSSTWQLINGQWKMVFHQGTTLKVKTPDILVQKP